MVGSQDLYTVEELIEQAIIEKPLDGNHGGSHPKGDDFIKEGIPFVMASDINNGKVDLNNCKFISREIADNLRKGFSKQGDVLLTHKASIGRTAIVPKIDTDYIMLTPQVTYYRIIDTNKLNNNYLKYYFDSRGFQNELNSRAGSGSTRAYIGITDQKMLSIRVLPIKQQKAIASILSALDDKIELNLQMNKTLEEMAMALYKHWFVDFGPFQDGKFVDSELGMIPEGWEVKKLEGIVEVCSSKRIFSREYIDFGVPFYRGKEIIQLSNGDEISNPLYISEDRFKEIDQKFGSPKRNDILVSSVGTIGRAWQVDNDDPFYFKDGNLTWIKNYNQEIDASYVYQWIISHEAQSQIKNATIGSTQQALTISSLRNILIIVPPLKLKLIADVISRIEILRDKININRKEIKTLSKTRDTLLPKLISGEVRLKEFQETIEQAL